MKLIPIILLSILSFQCTFYSKGDLRNSIITEGKIDSVSIIENIVQNRLGNHLQNNAILYFSYCLNDNDFYNHDIIEVTELNASWLKKLKNGTIVQIKVDSLNYNKSKILLK